jgi:archaellum biogenesis ATPase FlaH
MTTPTIESAEIMEKQSTFWEKYDRFKISMRKPIPEPKPIISIENHTISTAGNLTMLSGQSKTGKSSFCNVVIAGAIRGQEYSYDGFEPLYVDENKEQKAVIHIDTEQAMHNHYQNVKNGILERANMTEEPEYYYSYNIREIEIKQRKDFIQKLFEEASIQSNGVHLAVIDGLADFIKSVNDEYESNEIVDFFEKLSIRYECPILAIVHLNPNSVKERGHLGSQLQRKSESVLQIKKDDDERISYCQPTLLRNACSADVPIIQFEYDIDRKYHVYRGVKDKQENLNDKCKILRDIALQVFTKEPLQYSEAVEHITSITSKSEATAKRYIKEMKDSYNFIKQVEKKGQAKNEKYYVSLL